MRKMQKLSFSLLISFVFSTAIGANIAHSQSSWAKDNNNCSYLKIDSSNYKVECKGKIWKDEPDESLASIQEHLNDTAKKIAIKSHKKWFQISSWDSQTIGEYKKTNDGNFAKPAIVKANVKIGTGKMPSDGIEINPNYKAG